MKNYHKEVKMKEELKKVAVKWNKLSNQLKKGCMDYLSELLDSNDNNIDWEEIELPEYVSVAYDGGNHPEYDSNVFSTVYGIKAEGDNMYLHTEDCDEYDISYVSVSELYTLCDFLDQYKQEIGIK